jgi:hypothetical protein
VIRGRPGRGVWEAFMVKKKNQLGTTLASILLILVVLGVLAWLISGLFW